jgi:CubicO group peptidase (beta-lactamase class C family)
VVIESVSGQPLGTFLRERIFDPLQLRMATARGQINGAARAYSQPGSAFEKVDGHIYALGPGGIWSTPADLLRWADNYRTGNVGGPALLTRIVDGAQDTGIESPFPGARPVGARNTAGARCGWSHSRRRRSAPTHRSRR